VVQIYTLFATCPKGVEDLLSAECQQHQLAEIKAVQGGVHCSGVLENAYRLCLWSRVASRILLKLHTFTLSSYDELYRGVQSIDWSTHFDCDGSFAIDVHSAHQHITNSHYATLKIKDAIADQFKHGFARRPDVRRDRPDIRINAYIDRHECILYLDLSGEPLHIRGYRQQSGVAPLKENLAAAILLRAQWPRLAAENRPLIDPLCGSATLLVEAAIMAAGIAPGRLRTYFGFLHWKQHQPDSWKRLLEEAESGVDTDRIPGIIGIEKSYKVSLIARENIAAAGLEGKIEIRQADSLNVLRNPDGPAGLIVTNPPYGKRIGESRELKQLYLDLGRDIKNGFPNWNVALFTASHELARFFGLRAHHKNTLYNGPLKCTLYHYRIRDAGEHPPQPDRHQPESVTAETVQMFTNRLAKNHKHLSKWARRENVSCYRVYDADIPQYALAIDIYEDWVHVQEYEPPGSVNRVKAFVRLNEAVDMISRVLQVDDRKIVLKTRKKQSGPAQYTRQDEAGETLIGYENGLKFKLNLKDYLDTGLFPDHRLTRKLISRLASGKSFLNLFAYTGTATVYAAAGGARTTTTIDLSNTYLAWSRVNMELNGLTGKHHEFIRADCIKWLDEAQKKARRYQLIFMDPPTFSNSKRMDHTLDIKRDHVELIKRAMALLDDNGLMIFSCNAHGFKLDEAVLGEFAVRDITRITTSEDYRRKPAHVCWCLARDSGGLTDCRL
jgi:23S rRNA (guanine2445-N2)-methyltransferase / 23S rRNA (guanine2069-N7)-methyltransferase